MLTARLHGGELLPAREHEEVVHVWRVVRGPGRCADRARVRENGLNDGLRQWEWGRDRTRDGVQEPMSLGFGDGVEQRRVAVLPTWVDNDCTLRVRNEDVRPCEWFENLTSEENGPVEMAFTRVVEAHAVDNSTS